MKHDQMVRLGRHGLPRGPYISLPRFFSSLFTVRQQCHSAKRKECRDKGIQQTTHLRALPQLRSLRDPDFWTCKSTWRRARINTLRCLVGCTVGDFSALWILQTFYPELGLSAIMGASMASGITTSIVLETILLRRGVDQLTWSTAARTAMGMSMVSMLAMEVTENIVDYHLTGGVVDVSDPRFWMAATASVIAGFLAPLPYNYFRLRRLCVIGWIRYWFFDTARLDKALRKP